MKVKLNKPLEVKEVIRRTASCSELRVEYVVYNPEEKRLVAKLQPGAMEVALNEAEFAAAEAVLERGLGKVLAAALERVNGGGGDEAQGEAGKETAK